MERALECDQDTSIEVVASRVVERLCLRVTAKPKGIPEADVEENAGIKSFRDSSELSENQPPMLATQPMVRITR